MINKIINESLDVFKDTYKQAFLLKLVESILPYVIVLILIVPSAYLFDKDGLVVKLITFIVALISVLIVMGCMLAQWGIIHLYLSKKQISMKSTWQFVKSKCLTFVFANLFLIVVMGLVALPGGVLALLLNESSDFLKFISYTLIGIPMLYLIYRSIFTLVIVVADDIGVFDAFDLSIKLTKSNPLIRWVFFYCAILGGVNLLCVFSIDHLLSGVAFIPALLKFLLDFLVSYLVAILIFCSYAKSKEQRGDLMNEVCNESN